MRIGILTFHKPINYGAYLQSYSLLNRLREEFPDDDVEIVDYMASEEKRKIVIRLLWGIKHYGLKNSYRDLIKILSFRKVHKNLELSDKMDDDNLEKLYQFIDERYDLLVIGSDAVFNWDQNGYPTAFIPQYDFKKCKIVSYAASVHGLLYMEEPEDRIIDCGRVFSKMELVGVRDLNTEKFVKKCNEQVEPVHCCDPTVFINKEDIINHAGNFRERVQKKFHIDLNEKFIVLMMPDGLVSKKIRECFSPEYKIVTLFKPSKEADYYLYDLNPFEWAAVISKASLVVTSYFHGTLLALRQDIPVIALDCSRYNNDYYEGKINDLLVRRLSLSELYFDNSKISEEGKCDELIEVAKHAVKGEFNDRICQGMINERKAFDCFVSKLKIKMGKN